jgi:hypothetical protein
LGGWWFLAPDSKTDHASPEKRDHGTHTKIDQSVVISSGLQGLHSAQIITAESLDSFKISSARNSVDGKVGCCRILTLRWGERIEFQTKREGSIQEGANRCLFYWKWQAFVMAKLALIIGGNLVELVEWARLKPTRWSTIINGIVGWHDYIYPPIAELEGDVEGGLILAFRWVSALKENRSNRTSIYLSTKCCLRWQVYVFPRCERDWIFVNERKKESGFVPHGFRLMFGDVLWFITRFGANPCSGPVTGRLENQISKLP